MAGYGLRVASCEVTFLSVDTCLRNSKPATRNPYARSGAADGLDQNGADLVRIHVRGRAAILEIAAARVGRGHGNAHRGAAIADAVTECVHRRGLMQAGQALFVVRAVDLDVVVVPALELRHGLFDDLDAAFL